MGKKTLYFVIISLLLLLFMPLVAAGYRVADTHRAVLCRNVSRERLMQGQDSPGKLRVFLIPGDIVDINSASQRELELLPGIGEELAGRIIACRERNGPFESFRELLLIEGLDEECLRAMEEYICIGEDP